VSEQQAAPVEEQARSYPVRLAYAVLGAMTADLGCIIGAIGFIVLMAVTVIWAAQLTPCTSAGGIPCAH